jgi:hypothetical protein
VSKSRPPPLGPRELPDGWAAPPPPGQEPTQGWPPQAPPPQAPKPRKRRRLFMWVILAINLVFAWIMFEILASASSCQGMTGDDLDACQAGEGIGKTALVLIVLFIWALVDIVLAVLFLVTRGRAGTAYDR